MGIVQLPCSMIVQLWRTLLVVVLIKLVVRRSNSTGHQAQNREDS